MHQEAKDALTQWLVEPGGSMPHSQGLSYNPYPEQNKPNSSLVLILLRSILILSSHLRLSFPVGLPIYFFKALLLYFILATCPAHINLLDLITLNILGERYKL